MLSECGLHRSSCCAHLHYRTAAAAAAMLASTGAASASPPAVSVSPPSPRSVNVSVSVSSLIESIHSDSEVSSGSDDERSGRSTPLSTPSTPAAAAAAATQPVAQHQQRSSNASALTAEQRNRPLPPPAWKQMPVVSPELMLARAAAFSSTVQRKQPPTDAVNAGLAVSNGYGYGIQSAAAPTADLPAASPPAPSQPVAWAQSSILPAEVASSSSTGVSISLYSPSRASFLEEAELDAQIAAAQLELISSNDVLKRVQQQSQIRTVRELPRHHLLPGQGEYASNVHRRALQSGRTGNAPIRARHPDPSAAQPKLASRGTSPVPAASTYHTSPRASAAVIPRSQQKRSSSVEPPARMRAAVAATASTSAANSRTASPAPSGSLSARSSLRTPTTSSAQRQQPLQRPSIATTFSAAHAPVATPRGGDAAAVAAPQSSGASFASSPTSPSVPPSIAVPVRGRSRLHRSTSASIRPVAAPALRSGFGSSVGTGRGSSSSGSSTPNTPRSITPSSSHSKIGGGARASPVISATVSRVRTPLPAEALTAPSAASTDNTPRRRLRPHSAASGLTSPIDMAALNSSLAAAAQAISNSTNGPQRTFKPLRSHPSSSAASSRASTSRGSSGRSSAEGGVLVAELLKYTLQGRSLLPDTAAADDGAGPTEYAPAVVDVPVLIPHAHAAKPGLSSPSSARSLKLQSAGIAASNSNGSLDNPSTPRGVRLGAAASGAAATDFSPAKAKSVKTRTAGSAPGSKATAQRIAQEMRSSQASKTEKQLTAQIAVADGTAAAAAAAGDAFANSSDSSEKARQHEDRRLTLSSTVKMSPLACEGRNTAPRSAVLSHKRTSSIEAAEADMHKKQEQNGANDRAATSSPTSPPAFLSSTKEMVSSLFRFYAHEVDSPSSASSVSSGSSSSSSGADGFVMNRTELFHFLVECDLIQQLPVVAARLPAPSNGAHQRKPSLNGLSPSLALETKKSCFQSVWNAYAVASPTPASSAAGSPLASTLVSAAPQKALSFDAFIRLVSELAFSVRPAPVLDRTPTTTASAIIHLLEQWILPCSSMYNPRSSTMEEQEGNMAKGSAAVSSPIALSNQSGGRFRVAPSLALFCLFQLEQILAVHATFLARDDHSPPPLPDVDENSSSPIEKVRPAVEKNYAKLQQMAKRFMQLSTEGEEEDQDEDAEAALLFPAFTAPASGTFSFCSFLHLSLHKRRFDGSVGRLLYSSDLTPSLFIESVLAAVDSQVSMKFASSTPAAAGSSVRDRHKKEKQAACVAQLHVLFDTLTGDL